MTSSDQFISASAWPSSEDDLLDVSGPSAGHAVLDWRRDTIVGRMDGYRRAAEVLAEHALANPGDLAFLVYPIANCWRHHIELQLKDLLRRLQELLGEGVTSTRGHNVRGLWQEVQPRLVAAYPEDPTWMMTTSSAYSTSCTRWIRTGRTSGITAGLTAVCH